jgi:hypothetical protein
MLISVVDPDPEPDHFAEPGSVLIPIPLFHFCLNNFKILSENIESYEKNNDDKKYKKC